MLLAHRGAAYWNGRAHSQCHHHIPSYLQLRQAIDKQPNDSLLWSQVLFWGRGTLAAKHKFAVGMLAQHSRLYTIAPRRAAPRSPFALCHYMHFQNFPYTSYWQFEKVASPILTVMDLDIYWITLLVLLPTVVLLTGRGVFIRAFGHVHTRWRRVRQRDAAGKGGIKYVQASADTVAGRDASQPIPGKLEQATRFRTSFLSIYLLVMSSEWLSGPYLYPFLRDDKALPISIVVALYATAYTSAAISALGVGFLADRYGRRNACLAECVIHSLACLSVVLGSDSLPVLFLGRVLAGVGLTLLWTVFESWMVTEWNARGLEGDGCEMSRMFGMMTTANCMTAIVGGVLGHCMVSFIGSKLWPFGAGVVS